MTILNVIVSTVNIGLALLMLVISRDEQSQSGRYTLRSLAFLLTLNTTMIWY